MITKVDFSRTAPNNTSAYTLPVSVNEVYVSVDNGRLYISINGLEIVATDLSDGNITINNNIV